jgi:hypothetical protein
MVERLSPATPSSGRPAHVLRHHLRLRRRIADSEVLADTVLADVVTGPGAATTLEDCHRD